MQTAVLYIVVGVLCAPTSDRVLAAETAIQDDDAVVEKQKKDALERVRGMKSAVSDIAEGRVGVVPAART